MKFLKRDLFIKMLMLLLVVISLGGCKKEDDGEDFDGDDDTEIGKGSFTVKGSNYSGDCVSIPASSGASGKIDIIIASSSGTSFTIYNVPASGSSGSTTITEFTTSSSTNPFALSVLSSGSFLASLSGTFTKTGSKSFKFSIPMVDLSTDQTTTATGSGGF